jgi:hypothetical protein
MRLNHQINDMNHKVLWLLVNIVAMWHAMLASHDHELLLFTKSYKNEWNVVIN